jgi:hypothetical protein
MADDNLPVVQSTEGARILTLQRSLDELKRKYDPIEVMDTAILVTQAGKLMADDLKLRGGSARPDLRELGNTGQTNYGYISRPDYNPELWGKQGLHIYDKMRKNDGQVRATLRLVKTPVLAARWYVEPASDSAMDRKIALHINDNLFKWMTTSWMAFLTEALLMLDYGHYIFEKVWAMRDGKVVWRKFAPRHPLDVYEWKFDAHGGPAGVYLYPEYGAEQGDPTFIDIEKLALFSFEMEAGNVEGVSVLRSAYKHWYYKENMYKIDAIQKERHGIGVPIIVLPPGFTDQDKALAQEIGRNLRTNEAAHVVVPPGWTIEFLKLEGNVVSAIESAEHHDLLISRNILGQFLNNPAGTSQEEQQQLFLKATRYIADIVRDVINKYCIPQIVHWNWPGVDEYPELRARRIGDTIDWRTMSFAIRNLVGSGIIIPDDTLELWFRDELDLPKPDLDTQRIIVAPQEEGEIPDGAPDGMPGSGDATTAETRQNGGAGSKGVPNQRPGVAQPSTGRQSKASNMKKGPGSNGKVGEDRSGG